MAYKRRREIAGGAPESLQIPATATYHLVGDATQELLPGTGTPVPSNHGSSAGYEQFRERRIKENLERMQKLGIVDLSLKIKSTIAASSVKRASRNVSSDRKTPLRSSSLFATEPRRRSSRLQNMTPVSYVEEAKLPKEDGKRRKDSILLEEGAKPEIYTEEHEKLLGSTESTWTLFVDGYGADGRRIYDPVKGKTCHQCRQKTLGHRTHCCKCQMVQGQFCGDCLYMRYGEHVLEANQNPDWICPVCRGICNCSLCRQAKGWPPTGPLYKRIASLGYKSVAHFLIQTKRAPFQAESEDNNNKTPHSAKRSLAFTDMEVPADGKEAIVGQKLDYGDRETADSKDEKGDQVDCAKNDISMLNTGESEVKEGFGMEDKNDDQMEAEMFPEHLNKTVEDEKGEQEDCRETDISMLNIGESEVKDGPEMERKNDDQMETEMGLEHLNKTGESKDEKGEQEDCRENDISMLNIGESEVKEVPENGKNDDQMEAEMSPEHVNGTGLSSELKADSVADRTSRCNNPDASKGIVQTDKTVESEVISSNKRRATKTCWTAKLATSLTPIQDSIARRLRPRNNKA